MGRRCWRPSPTAPWRLDRRRRTKADTTARSCPTRLASSQIRRRRQDDVVDVSYNSQYVGDTQPVNGQYKHYSVVICREVMIVYTDGERALQLQ